LASVNSHEVEQQLEAAFRRVNRPLPLTLVEAPP
jgi:hypothetical protein